MPRTTPAHRYRLRASVSSPNRRLLSSATGRAPIVNTQHSCVLAGPLDHLGARGGELREHALRVLVRAVLAPQRREDPQLGEGGGAAQHRLDAAVLVVGEIVVANQGGGDRRIAPERSRTAHASRALAPETPRSTAPNTRAKSPCPAWCSKCSASPASNHRP